MRIAELSQRSGVTIPTIKYYLREGLLPSGALTSQNQASYSERHLHRLRLIRALREAGGLSVSASQRVLQILDEPQPASVRHLMGQACRAVVHPSRHDPADPDWARAWVEAADRVRELGWRVTPEAPALDRLADVFLAVRRVGRADLLDHLPHYASAALALAEHEVPAAAGAGDPAAIMAAVVTGTVLGEALLTAVRLLAQEHVSAGLNPDEPVDLGVAQPDTRNRA